MCNNNQQIKKTDRNYCPLGKHFTDIWIHGSVGQSTFGVCCEKCYYKALTKCEEKEWQNMKKLKKQ